MKLRQLTVRLERSASLRPRVGQFRKYPSPQLKVGYSGIRLHLKWYGLVFVGNKTPVGTKANGSAITFTLSCPVGSMAGGGGSNLSAGGGTLAGKQDSRSGNTFNQRTRDEPLGKHQCDPDQLPTVYAI